MGKLKMHTMDLKTTSKTVIVNKVTKDTKGDN